MASMEAVAPEEDSEAGYVHARVAAQVEAAQLRVRQLLDGGRPDIEPCLRQRRCRRRIEARALHRPRKRVVVEHYNLAVFRLLPTVLRSSVGLIFARSTEPRTLQTRHPS